MRGTLRLRAVREIGLRFAAARARGIILVYHRVTALEEPGPGIVPSISQDLLRRHVSSLTTLGAVVPLEALTSATATNRPLFVLTFDDDYVEHRDIVLPVLQELGVTASFFLCGRRLHGLGPTWFEVLDALVRQRGVEPTSRLIGARARSAEELAVACEASDRLQDAIADAAGALDAEPRSLDEAGIAALSAANMTIGFHTLEHRVLPLLEDARVERELTEGRAAMEAVATRPVSLFAYPHGKADLRTASAVRRAGYAAAVTGRPTPTTPRTDPFLLGRWEPGRLPPDELSATVTAKLNRRPG